MKRDADRKLVPLTTVAITFSSTTLPKYVFINLFRYQVNTYIPPLVQCYKCFKFNHSAKICRSEQMCSSCSGNHLYKECLTDTLLCINCGGAHLAISRDCPIKKKKLEEKRNLIVNQHRTFASIVKDDNNFPVLKSKPVHKIVNNSDNIVNDSTFLNKKSNVVVEKNNEIEKIANNEIILNAIVKSLVALANSTGTEPMTLNKIKDVFLSNLL
ncbi:hypothetical protein PYW07_006899 [Mythimna separata]|uniref:Nucleic-acid-binding protein from mobile element jockey n=1 Tax=Mythimna separata TaxID=271217 RepID=A0AAD8DUW7_MYTSE|nr:hypothetical protein PYW07_005887 [Mythimna separata]KAJ8724990.1 hypothetical protein PYW07_015948 [Mythimna separata]KAJ8731468.1 hypothetical protein PYW07_004632 [Mythimna separata]KAJ8735279.1 hypothetical protein PYW07_006899 [Mythimna separata]